MRSWRGRRLVLLCSRWRVACHQAAGAMIGFPADDDVGRRLADPGAAERNLKRGCRAYDGIRKYNSRGQHARGPAVDRARPLVGRAGGVEPPPKDVSGLCKGRPGIDPTGQCRQPVVKNTVCPYATATEAVQPAIQAASYPFGQGPAPLVDITGLSGGEGPVHRPRLGWAGWGAGGLQPSPGPP